MVAVCLKNQSLIVWFSNCSNQVDFNCPLKVLDSKSTIMAEFFNDFDFTTVSKLSKLFSIKN